MVSNREQNSLVTLRLWLDAIMLSPKGHPGFFLLIFDRLFFPVENGKCWSGEDWDSERLKTELDLL